MSTPSISIPVDLTNPGQFFACCGLLELADRLSGPAEGWFEAKQFMVRTKSSLCDLVHALRRAMIGTGISAAQDEREEPVILESTFSLRIDWFRDDYSGGSRFKTWAGRQSVLEIATAMQAHLGKVQSSPWISVRDGGLPFNFDSDLGGQGSALDIGFSFDPLAASDRTRIKLTCRPALELLAFIGLQRFRAREIAGRNRFVYAAWGRPLPPTLAAAVACQAIPPGDARCYEFRLLYRNKYYKSFLPAIPFQGDNDE